MSLRGAQVSKRIASRISTMFVLGGLASCSGITAPAAGPDTTSFEPVWISASWGGGAVTPTDRTNREPTPFNGARCPATSVRLENYISGNDAPKPSAVPGLYLWNNCTDIISVGICVRKGSAAQPAGNFHLSACATDPLLTPFLDLAIFTINSGRFPGVFIPTSGSPSIEAFFCSDRSWLLAPPAAAKVSCVAF